jgi:hypothetical protein
MVAYPDVDDAVKLGRLFTNSATSGRLRKNSRRWICSAEALGPNLHDQLYPTNAQMEN